MVCCSGSSRSSPSEKIRFAGTSDGRASPSTSQGKISPIALPKLKLSEERRLPVLLPLLEFVKSLLGIESDKTALATAEADFLLYKVRIRERYPLELPDYTFNEALLDLARYRKAADVD